MSPVCASVCLSVCLSVCPSRWIFSTIFVRFWWKCTQMILTKIWDDTFFIFSKFCFDDVITAILYVFRWGTLTVVIFKQFSSNWQHVFFYGWLCMGLQTSVLRHHLQGKMTMGKPVKKTKWRKTQNKSPILIDFDLLNTNMCMVCRFDRYFRCKWPLKLTEIEFMRVLIRLQLKYNLTNFDKTAQS